VYLTIIYRSYSPIFCDRYIVYTYMDELIMSMNSAGDNATAAVTNSTALDGGKFQIIFCLERSCRPDARTCYCCGTVKPFYCYDTRSECRAKCDVCNPKCPPHAALPQSPAGRLQVPATDHPEHHRLNSTLANAT